MFGLGNKQYEHFCAVGHKVHAAMEQLGALPVVSRGDGDDDVDIDADFESWRTELYTSLDKSPLIQQKEVRGTCNEADPQCCVRVQHAEVLGAHNESQEYYCNPCMAEMRLR